MARSKKEAVIIIIDVGQSVSQQTYKHGRTYLDMSKTCVSKFIQRKIFAMDKDDIGIILLGTDETDNSLDYKNITVAIQPMRASWDMLETIEKDVQGTEIRADWLDALICAMEVLKTQSESQHYSARKIFLFTNCGTPVDDDQIELIIKGIQSEDIRLIAVNPDIVSEDDVDVCFDGSSSEGSLVKKTEEQDAGEKVLTRILKKTHGVVCGFTDRVFNQKKKIQPTPWNVCLDIGPDIQIPVSGFRKIAEVTVPSWKETCSTEDVILEKEKVYLKEDRLPIDKDNVIGAYLFGTTLIPFNESDKDAMAYKSGKKCFSVLCFTEISNIPKHLLVGCGVHYFVTQKNKPEAKAAFSALVYALKELNMVAVVRKVYIDNSAPYIGFLFPIIKTECQCLGLVEAAYSEDVREFIFPSLKSEMQNLKPEQLQAIDSLIDNMDLMNTEKDGCKQEAFCPTKTFFPFHEHLYNTLAHRAMYPESELPPVSQDIKDSLKCPFEQKMSYKEALTDIKKNFDLVVQTKKFFKKDKQVSNPVPVASTSDKLPVTDIADVNMVTLMEPVLIEVGTITPDHDFLTLLEKGESLKEVCIQMQKVILNLVMKSFGADSFPKAQSALKTLRTTCCEKDFTLYNDWFPQVKENLLERGKDGFWELVTENNLGLITQQENSKSPITAEFAAKFMEVEKESQMEVTTQVTDVDDLLNEM